MKKSEEEEKPEFKRTLLRIDSGMGDCVLAVMRYNIVRGKSGMGSVYK